MKFHQFSIKKTFFFRLHEKWFDKSDLICGKKSDFLIETPMGFSFVLFSPLSRIMIHFEMIGFCFLPVLLFFASVSGCYGDIGLPPFL